MRPRLAVTLGDPAGIGPEVCGAALAALGAAPRPCDVVLVGPAPQAEAIAARLPYAVDVCGQAPFSGPLGEASAAAGGAALAALQAAIDLAQRGAVQGLVTAPINKHALHLAGSAALGHTEILARALGRGPTAMAFFAPTLRLVLATTHVPLRAVFAALTPGRVLEVARLLDAALRRSGHHPPGRGPRLGLAGLNPHAGEGGLMGREELEVLAPAVAAARQEGLDLSAPVSPDVIFREAAAGAYDGVVALYHDQGLIPVKMLAFGTATNVTLGLAVVRTSPDHGTAYDRVGTNTARCEGMLAALQVACTLVLQGPQAP